jgi:uncharacterized membrane protein YhaH (DUF805 family)
MTATVVPTRPSLRSELFAASGRTNRGRYWLIGLLTVAVQVPVAFVLGFALDAAGVSRGNVPNDVVPVEILMLVLAVPAMLAGIRRLHDRDKSGHWAWLLVLAPPVLIAFGPPILMVVGLAIAVWAFVELGCLRGTTGPNRFGPDPLQRAPA